MTDKPRFAVVNLHCRSYCVHENKISWTYDRAKAEAVAARVLGVVVDADAFAKNPTEFFNRHKPKE